jgi:hypothetical protein
MAVFSFNQATPLLAEWITAVSQPKTSGLPFLLRAVQAGRIALTVVTGHRTVWTPRSLRSALPTVVLISDDDDAVPGCDPDEWRCAMSAIAWARGALVHGAAVEARHYESAVDFAEVVGRFLLVETDSFRTAAWLQAIAPRQIPRLAVIPRPGQIHPVRECVV